MPIDDFVKELVHEALYVAACGYGSKAQMAEAELRDRGDIISADTAATLRELRTRSIQVMHDRWQEPRRW